jgi:tRNA (mo5U34)-methyltransferase
MSPEDQEQAAGELSGSQLRDRIRALGPWYQNIEVAPGVWTKDLDGTTDIFPGYDIPAPLWRYIARDLPDLTGKRVLDIGCNAGYMSFESKRLGAEYVLGIDSNLGAGTSFVEQAEFCRDALGLDVDFSEESFFDHVPVWRYHVILFCGVLYHLEDYAGALDKIVGFAAPGEGLIVLETAIERITRTLPGDMDYKGDATTFFLPSIGVLTEIIRERGLEIEVLRDLGTRALAFVRCR